MLMIVNADPRLNLQAFDKHLAGGAGVSVVEDFDLLIGMGKVWHGIIP